MTDQYIHPQTRLQLNAMKAIFPQTLILTGKPGVGLKAVAKYLCQDSEVASFVAEKDGEPNEKGSIGVDVIRRIRNLSRSKQSKARVFLIVDGDKLTQQAQNAFLKLLEEPGENNHFIILSHFRDTLLPTVISRSQTVKVLPITRKESEQLLQNFAIKSEQKRTQILFMAEGLPEEIEKLATDDAYFEKRVAIMKDAKDLLQAKTYQKLKIIHTYRDDRITTLQLLTDAMNILKTMTTSQKTTEYAPRIDQLLDVYAKIKANGNVKLNLTTLVV